jgi:hypothetical protein
MAEGRRQSLTHDKRGASLELYVHRYMFLKRPLSNEILVSGAILDCKSGGEHLEQRELFSPAENEARVRGCKHRMSQKNNNLQLLLLFFIIY